MIRIIYTPPSGITEEYQTAADSVLIGRQLPAKPGHLNLPDGQVSSQHARITFQDGQFWAEDMGSTNGTWTGRMRIREKTPLTPESVLRIGHTSLKVEGLPDAKTPVRETQEKQAPESKPSEVVAANKSLSDLVMTGTSLEAAHRRLSALCELSASLVTPQSKCRIFATFKVSHGKMSGKEGVCGEYIDWS